MKKIKISNFLHFRSFAILTLSLSLSLSLSLNFCCLFSLYFLPIVGVCMHLGELLSWNFVVTKELMESPWILIRIGSLILYYQSLIHWKRSSTPLQKFLHLLSKQDHGITFFIYAIYPMRLNG
jgi:hypothetical protein